MSQPSRSPTPSFSPPPEDHDFEASSSSAPAPPPPAPVEREVSPFPELPADDAEADEPTEDVAMADEPRQDEVAPAPAPEPAPAEVDAAEEDDEPKAETAAERQAAEKAALELQVFGDDSDLSSDDDDHRPAPSKPARRSPSASRSPSRSRSPSAQPSEDEAAGGNYSDGEDADAREKKLKFKKSKDKKKAKNKDDGEDGADKPKKTKKRKAPAAPEPQEDDEDRPEEPADEATLRRMALNRKIDEIVRAPKNKRKKSKRADGEDDLDEVNDDLIVKLKDKMMAAAERDEDAVMNKKPASAKLTMLREVMSVLQQSTMQQSIVDNDLLTAVRRWLEPLPDKSLPALDIQNSFFDILVKMPFIDTDTLKASQLGKIILFYSKSLRSTAHVKRQASDLLAAWSRPIIKRSSSFRTKSVPTVDIRRDREEEEGMGRSQSQGGSQSHGQGQSQKKPWERQEGEKIDKKRRNVRIPAPSSTTYTHAPKYDQISGPVGGGESSQAQQRRQKDQERLKRMKKQLADARTAERL